jgi:hypothetical protein
MKNETIQLRTETGQVVEAVVLSKHADRIEVVIAEAMRCALTPTRNQRAYAGTLRGRELVYERSRADVAAELTRRDPRRPTFK